MKVSEKIKLARKKKGLTQKELAEIVGAATATINKIEADDAKETSIKNTSFKLAVKIALALDCNVFELFGDESANSLNQDVSSKEIDRLKVLVFHALDRYESEQVLFKSFEFGENTPEALEKFELFQRHLKEFKSGMFRMLISIGFCTLEEVKEYFDHINPNKK